MKYSNASSADYTPYQYFTIVVNVLIFALENQLIPFSPLHLESRRSISYGNSDRCVCIAVGAIIIIGGRLASDRCSFVHGMRTTHLNN